MVLLGGNAEFHFIFQGQTAHSVETSKLLGRVCFSMSGLVFTAHGEEGLATLE